MSAEDKSPKKKPEPSKTPSAGRKDPLRRMLDEHALAHQQRHQEQARRLLEQAADSAKRMMLEGYTLEMALEELEAARMAAMTRFPPDAAAAVAAVMGKAKLMGLVVDKAAVLHGSPSSEGGDIFLTGDIQLRRQELLERLNERLGSRKADLVLKAIEGPKDDEE